VLFSNFCLIYIIILKLLPNCVILRKKNKSSYIQYTQHCIYEDIFVWISSIVKTQNTFGSDIQDIDNSINN
jgi:hypothetical protein